MWIEVSLFDCCVHDGGTEFYFGCELKSPCLWLLCAWWVEVSFILGGNYRCLWLLCAWWWDWVLFEVWIERSLSLAVVCVMGGTNFYFGCELNSPCLGSPVVDVPLWVVLTGTASGQTLVPLSWRCSLSLLARTHSGYIRFLLLCFAKWSLIMLGCVWNCIILKMGFSEWWGWSR